MERAHLRENFHLGLDAFHLLQLSTNQFFPLNGKQLASRYFESNYFIDVKSTKDKIKTLNNKPYCYIEIDCLSLLLKFKPGNFERETSETVIEQ